MSVLITTETFYEIPVRIVQGDIGPMIPLVDIADGIGYAKQNILSLFERNSELLKEDSQDIIMITGDQVAPTPHTCLTRDGVIGLLMKTDYQRIKDPAKREKILSFQKWAKETLGKVMDGSLQASRSLLPPLSDALKEELARADAMTIIGVDRGLAASACMSKLEDQYGEKLDYLRALVPRSSDETIAYLTATAIGKEFSLSPQSVNKILEKEGYQFHTVRMKKTGKTTNVWNLTDKGKEFGEIHIERHGGKEIYTILWRCSIIGEMQRILFQKDCNQNTLIPGLV